MIKYYLLTFLFLSAPLGLDWKKDYKTDQIPKIEGYRYYYGDISWGQIVYLGNDDIIGLETEIHLNFIRKAITSAVLILGPSGLGDYNCMKKYKDLLDLLNHKYGHYKKIHEVKDPLIDDLIFSTTCYPMKVGLHEIRTLWNFDKFSIEALLFGDDDGYYIEITYTNLFKKDNTYNIKKEIMKL